MITISFDAVTAKIANLPEEVIEALKYSFTVDLEDEVYEEFLKTGLPLTSTYLDHRHLLEVKDDHIQVPTGLLVKVTRKLREIGMGFQVNRTLVEPERSGLPMNPILRPQQKLAVETFLKHKRGFIESPTRSGKSFIIAEFFNQFKQGTYCLVIVPTCNLLYQMQEDIASYLKIDPSEIGLMGDGKLILKPITIAIPNTIVQRVQANHAAVIQYLSQVQVSMYDECHRYINPRGASVNSYTPNAVYKVAVSATPWVQSILLLEAFTGPKLLEFTAEEMMEEKILMEPIIRFYEAPSSFAPKKLLDMELRNFKDPKVLWAWNQLTDYLIVNNSGRNKLAATITKDLIDSKIGPILILVKKVGTSGKANAISHADIFQEILEQEYGVNLPIIHGKSGIKKQQQALEDLDSYKIPALIASAGILSEGVTIRSLAAVVLLCAGSSDINFVQRVGRSLGLKENRPIIVDFIDHHVFERQSQKRIECAERIYPGCVEILSEYKAA